MTPNRAQSVPAAAPAIMAPTSYSESPQFRYWTPPISKTIPGEVVAVTRVSAAYSHTPTLNSANLPISWNDQLVCEEIPGPTVDMNFTLHAICGDDTTSTILEVKRLPMTTNSAASRVRKDLTVGELAERSGLAVSAIHFYESKGLISAWRSAGNQRRYSRDILRRVAVIKVAQRIGIPLPESLSVA